MKPHYLTLPNRIFSFLIGILMITTSASAYDQTFFGIVTKVQALSPPPANEPIAIPKNAPNVNVMDKWVINWRLNHHPDTLAQTQESKLLQEVCSKLTIYFWKFENHNIWSPDYFSSFSNPSDLYFGTRSSFFSHQNENIDQWQIVALREGPSLPPYAMHFSGYELAFAKTILGAPKGTLFPMGQLGTVLWPLDLNAEEMAVATFRYATLQFVDPNTEITFAITLKLIDMW